MKPLLSISMLASRNIEDVRRCLDSLQPIMEAIPCELILVDTSAQPNVGKLLREYTDCVISFLWCNDFSKARNVGLEAARGEWFLYLDDDEWFVETEELIQFFASGEYRNYGYANYIQRNFFDPDYETFTDNWVSRMVRLAPDTRFQSKIHEYLHPVYGAGKNLKAVVNHSGYIYLTDEDRKKRFLRNEPLLLQMMEEEPQNLRWAVQLAQEYYSVEEWSLLEALCRRALSQIVYQTQLIMKRLASTFYAGIAEALIGQAKYEMALEEIQSAFRKENCSPLGKAYLFLQEGICYFYLRNWDKAYASIEQYRKLELEITANEEQYVIWQEALIADGAYDVISKKKAYTILLAYYLVKNDKDEVLHYFTLLEWEKKAVYVFTPILPIIFEEVVRQKDDTYIKTLWLSILKQEKIYDLLVKECRCVWMRLPEEKRAGDRRSYCELVTNYMRQYYRETMIQDYYMLLPLFVQRALVFIDQMEAEECLCKREN